MKIRLSDRFTYAKLIRFTLPTIAMMIFTSIYGVVDGFFVSNFAGKTAFAAVNLIWPFLMIVATVGLMFGTGGTAIVAKTMGEGDYKRANAYFSLFTYVSFFLGVILCVISFIFITPISRMLGAEGKLLSDCVTYARVLLIALPFYVLQMLFQSFMVAAEKPAFGFVVTVFSGVTNMVLDAALVILLPQEHKLLGAAIATAASQIVGAIIPLVYFFAKNGSVLRLGRTAFYGKAIVKACVNGSSEFMSNLSMSIVGILSNLQLMKYAGENGVSAYGVMMYVSMIFAGAFIGYSIGVAPVLGYNFGAKNKPELRGLLRKSLVMVAVFGVVMLVLSQALAAPLAQLFVGYDHQLAALTVDGFRIFSLSFAPMGFAIFGSGFFTALSDGVTSAVISFLRTMVLQVLAVMLLPLVLGVDGIWWSVVVAELMASVLCFTFIPLKHKRLGY